jgi:hypothetical protein
MPLVVNCGLLKNNKKAGKDGWFSLSWSCALLPLPTSSMANPQKIDLHESYPCPSCRGKISPIVMMTEAFGCDRCQKIFTLHADGHSIEQVSNPDPTRYCWEWDGKRWVSVNSSGPIGSWTFLVMLMVTMVMVVYGWQTLVPSNNKPLPSAQTSPSP